MAVLKCKMCGGDLPADVNINVVECDFCGTVQTVPANDAEKIINLFNRANMLRIKKEFDKASGIYENIVSEFPNEAEAYWGLCLCKYGIEYVDDPATARKIPTCHRTLSASIQSDHDYINACNNADAASRVQYAREAAQIDAVQRRILDIASREEPYDIFICYKETDDYTKLRTEDSTIAQDLYTALVEKGYKVFYSRVTLRNKAGSDYEAYIYSALNSASVMLAIGTTPAYYDAVWVKNEWSRFLRMHSGVSGKALIACYKGFDAYELPAEFANIQALNINTVTFYDNLINSIPRFFLQRAHRRRELRSMQQVQRRR